MTHKPLDFLSGNFKGSQLRWVTSDKKGLAIVSTFRHLEHLLWDGLHIFTDHRNLAYIFNPEACVTSVSRHWHHVWRVGKLLLASIVTRFTIFWMTVTHEVICSRVG
ncbi:unnamed protein product [Sphacelaria rigidula]